MRRWAGMVTGGRAPSGRRLFAFFAIALLVPVLAVGLFLNAAYRRDAMARTLSDGRAQAQILAETAIVPVISDQDLERGLELSAMADLGAAVESSVREHRVVSVRVMSPTGRIVFPPGTDTTTAPAGGALSGAAAGTASASLLTLADDTARRVGYRGQVVQVYAPLVAPADRRVLGVVEVRLPYAEVSRAVARQVREFDLILAAGLVALYLLVAAISWTVTRRLHRESQRNEYLALHDPLTGLANRELFRLRAALAVSRRGGGPCSVAIIDLNRFKEVNDGLGHASGDLLLVEVARRLERAVRTDDTVARLGGDEFGVLLPGTSSTHAAMVLAAAVDEVSEPVRVSDVEVTVGASVGIAASPAHGDDVADLLRHADIAMYSSKVRGRPVTVFDDTMEPAGRERLTLVSELARAVPDGQLVLHYQPIVRLCDRSVVGVEALVRWNHPTRGLLPPSSFLPAAEETGLIDALTEWVLRTAPAEIDALADVAPDLRLSVNVSARTLHDPDFGRRLARLLRGGPLPPDRVVLEMTETALVRDAAAVRSSLRAARALGVGVSMDDFGQGTTSLVQLSELPLTEMKLDRAVVALADRSQGEANLVAAVVSVARGLDLSVVAEGVEDPADLDRLAAAGCSTAQGWAIARPMPLAELRRWFGAEPARPDAVRVPELMSGSGVVGGAP